jgi:hypothetical protein
LFAEVPTDASREAKGVRVKLSAMYRLATLLRLGKPPVARDHAPIRRLIAWWLERFG